MLTKRRAPREGTRIKKGTTTDYVSRQYIGNIGKTDNGIVSVNAYAVVEEITYPLIFKIFKPRKRLKESDEYKTNIKSLNVCYTQGINNKWITSN